MALRTATLLFIALAAVPRLSAATAHAIATFESLGLYFDHPEVGPCRVSYRATASGSTWREGYPLVYDSREHQYRGSLVQLTPDTEYTIRLTAGQDTAEFTARTRSDRFPIGKTTMIPGGTLGEPLKIFEGGTAQGWHLITPASGSKVVSDVFNLADYNILIAADYVILRGFELRNAAVHGVSIAPGVQNIVIEDCHITGWGRIGGARVWGVTTDMDSGIYAARGAGRLVIQRNLIEYPRGGSNDWESGHPNGPQGISLINSSGENVIRFNTIRSTEDHGFNDGIGGAENFSFAGSPNRDSDIYGNIVANCWDDAIESEGANRNVRIWSNYLHHTYTHIATAATSVGPIYIFRNVFGLSRISHLDPSGGKMIKTGMNVIDVNGEKVSTGLGYRFIFHNTALQPNGALNVFSSHEVHNAVTRNNIFFARGEVYPKDRGAPPNDFQHDLKGDASGGLLATTWVPGNGLEWFLAPMVKRIEYGKIERTVNGRKIVITDPLQDVPNPAIDSAVPLPGFNDDFTGKAPDMGAFENGRPALRFGREMAPDFQRAPWEVQ